jgi:hypothetical protein
VDAARDAAERLLELHDALDGAALRHAFGGAIALAYCTHEPRRTRDLDVNVFVAPQLAQQVFAALPEGIARSEADLAGARAGGQVRLWWQDTPVDIFFNAHPFHQQVERGVRLVSFCGRTVPIVGCTELAVFKTLIGRTKDWADIEEMVQLGELSLADALVWVAQLLGSENPAVVRLETLAA